MSNELFHIDGVQAPQVSALSELANAGEHYLKGRDDAALKEICGISTMDHASEGWTGVVINATENADEDLEFGNIDALWVSYAEDPSHHDAKYALAMLEGELTPWAVEAEVAVNMQRFAEAVFNGDHAATEDLQMIAVHRRALWIKDSKVGLSAEEEAYGDVLYEAAEELLSSSARPGIKVKFDWDHRGGGVSVHAEGIVGDRIDGGLSVPLSPSKLRAALSASDLSEAHDALSIGSKVTP
ncbi:hypothetical protein [Xanthomonas arboricola]|uniref:Uncharacterized protein n=1 Tax=Xanthomonas arboricola TaxID=56448 RepID=A0AB73H3R4_9XANT|nr:hypothetical protein [Xanthomonas arboricola]MBB5672318.1 hypothetical protein [Xanthomonas arboricola]